MSKSFDSIPSEWAKHLRPRLKRAFWKKVRCKIRKELREKEKDPQQTSDQ